MILDKETLFSLDQKVTASAESESIIDLSPLWGSSAMSVLVNR